MSFAEVDCEKCDNYEDYGACISCMHSPNLEDNFESSSPEKKVERVKEHRAKFITSIPKEEVSIEPTPEFMERLKLAWKFTPTVESENERHYCVYCGKNYLMSTDQYRMARIDADCPKEFIDRHLVWDDLENKLYIRAAKYETVLSNGQAQELLDKSEGWKITGIKSSIPFKDIQPSEGDDVKDGKVTLCNIVRLKKFYVNDVLEIIPDDELITVTYKGMVDAIRIKALGIDALILPIRYLREGK